MTTLISIQHLCEQKCYVVREGSYLIRQERWDFFFRCSFFFALNQYTGLKIKSLPSPWILVHINPYIWPLVFDNLVETTHPKCFMHLLRASLFSASYVLFLVLKSPLMQPRSPSATAIFFLFCCPIPVSYYRILLHSYPIIFIFWNM